LDHGDRHVRRKVLTTDTGERVTLDLAQATHLRDGDVLVAEDGTQVRVIAAPEHLMEVTIADPRALIGLAWQIGNRHLPAQLETTRILIQRDHVIRDMLIGLGASVRDVVEPFQPEPGAYSGHAHANHAHAHTAAAHDHH
ncbi:MAG: urease accessory protein UreE, partial [Pseudomonadota bacterium]